MLRGKHMKDYAKENFYNYFLKDKPINDCMEKLQKVSDSGFYEVCCLFLDVNLNSIKFKDVSAIFQHKDIDFAVNETRRFIEEQEITDANELLDLVYEYHPKAIRARESRCMGGVVWEENSSLFGKVGKYYNFSKIPLNIWEEIKKKIINE